MQNQPSPKKTNLKRQHQDGVFKKLFKVPQNFILLLNWCRDGNSTLTANDIKPFDLDSNFAIRPQYNDVSFTTKDNKLIILVEHQSTPCANIALRLFLYYTEILQLWIKQNGLSLHDKKKITELPVPEFYVIYNGERPQNHTHSTFSLDSDVMKVNVQVKTMSLQYQNLTNPEPSNNLAGYAFLYHEYNKARKTGKSRQEAFTVACKECIKNRYLLGIVDKEDFIMDYKDIFDRDTHLLAEGKAEGRAEGKAENLLENVTALLKSGFDLQAVAKALQLSEAQISQVKQALA